MPIYGRGLWHGSPSGHYKDASVYPDNGKFPVFSGFAQNEPPMSAEVRQTGKIVSIVAVLVSIGLLVATVTLGKKDG